MFNQQGESPAQYKEEMRTIEIHKGGANAHCNTISYYGIDYESKSILFNASRVEEAIEKAKELGYKLSEIQRMF